MSRFLAVSLLVVMMLVPVSAFSAGIQYGYAGIKWGTDLRTVQKTFKKGETTSLHGDILYKQTKPNKAMAHRTFIFKDNRLAAVTIKFSPAYVKKVGIEKLLAIHKKSYGEGTMDRSQAPHMVSYIWRGAHTTITYAYAPRRPDMTVIMFQQQ